MGRYKEKETTSLSDMVPPPFIHAFEIEDTKTGRIGKGAGYTKKEARNNAWRDLKFGEDPKYRETPIDRPISSGSGGGGGGGGGGTSISSSGLDDLAGCLIVVLLLLIGVFGVFTGLDYLSRKTEDLIKRVYPSYETSREKSLKTPILVENGLHPCQIIKIEFQKTDNKSEKVLGWITYLDENDQPNTIPFVGIRSTDEGVKDSLAIIDTRVNHNDRSPANYYGQTHIPFNLIQKIRFETIPYSEIKRWPSSFSTAGIPVPMIKTEVEYKNGITATYSTYATVWIYFSYYQKR